VSHGVVRHISLKLCRVDLEEELALPLDATHAAALFGLNGRLGLYYPSNGGAVLLGVRG